MNVMNTLLLAVAVLLSGGIVPGRAAEKSPTASVPQDLFRYMARPEPNYSWTLADTHTVDAGKVYVVRLVSQKWHDIVWKHNLLICEPKHLRHPSHVLLFVTGGHNGGRPSRKGMAMGLKLATLCGARVAVLSQVPNQPLLGNHVEDDLITETWLRYLKTGDSTWPLLFPMVKSAVKAMDAVTELAKSRWNQSIEGFVITGGSKRGWTSWLTAVADKRILATAPMVIDTLNFQPQMKHQLATWGEFSEQIVDYTRKGLIKVNQKETPREVHLRRMMDPYTYRKQLTLPKLLINGTNDRYWVVDALNNYWDGLSGPKYALYITNAGHGLKGGHDKVFATEAAYFQHVVTRTALPKLKWKHDGDGELLQLTMSSQPAPTAVRLWSATSNSKDFRLAKWTSRKVPGHGGEYIAKLEKNGSGHVALFGEFQFRFNGLEYFLSTQIRRD